MNAAFPRLDSLEAMILLVNNAQVTAHFKLLIIYTLAKELDTKIRFLTMPVHILISIIEVKWCLRF